MKHKRLFYDIETSFCQGHFWRPGWNQTIHPHQITEHAKIISIHWKWEGENEVHNVDWGLKKQCDKAPLKRFLKEIRKADEIITHNGKKFDTPWLRARAIYHGLDFPHTLNEIDTYKLAKKYLNLPSYSLKEICNYYGLEAKKDAGGIETWVNVVYHKDKEALDHLLYYGDGDILSLEAVFNKLRPYVKPNMQYAVLRGETKFHCPECGNLPHYKQMYTTAAGTIQHYLQCSDRKECRTQFKVNNKTYQDYIQYKLVNGIK